MINMFRCFLDIDECASMPGPCDEYADCADTDGSYNCTCRAGFTGNGLQCEGTVQGEKFKLVCNFVLLLSCSCASNYLLLVSHNIVSKINMIIMKRSSVIKVI